MGRLNETGSLPIREKCWECRRRRLVCDLGKPSCMRCLSEGMTCSGYGATKPFKFITPNVTTSWEKRGKKKSRAKKAPKEHTPPDDAGGLTSSTSSRSQDSTADDEDQQIETSTTHDILEKVQRPRLALSDSWYTGAKGNPHGLRALHFYAHSAATALSVYATDDFWHKVVPLQCHSMAFVRHALIALGGTLLTQQEASTITTPQALAAYGRSLQDLRAYMTHNLAPSRTAVVSTSIILYVFCLASHDPTSARYHIDNAIAIFNSWPPTTQSHPNFSTIKFVLLQLDIHASLLDTNPSTPKSTSWTQSPNRPLKMSPHWTLSLTQPHTPFTSARHARQMLAPFERAAAAMWVHGATRQENWLQDSTTSPIPEASRVQAELSAWKAATSLLEGQLGRCIHGGGSKGEVQDMMVFLVAKGQYVLTRYILTRALGGDPGGVADIVRFGGLYLEFERGLRRREMHVQSRVARRLPRGFGGMFPHEISVTMAFAVQASGDEGVKREGMRVLGEFMRLAEGV